MEEKKGGDKLRIDKNKIELILAEKGLTQAVAAEKSGLSQSRYTVIINSEAVRPKTVGKIAQGLGVPIEDIIDMKEYKKYG